MPLVEDVVVVVRKPQAVVDGGPVVALEVPVEAPALLQVRRDHVVAGAVEVVVGEPSSRGERGPVREVLGGRVPVTPHRETPLVHVGVVPVPTVISQVVVDVGLAVPVTGDGPVTGGVEKVLQGLRETPVGPLDGGHPGEEVVVVGTHRHTV